MIARVLALILAVTFAVGWGFAGAESPGPLEFTLHKRTGRLPGPTVLVIGGIQGDEPGGFNAASLLVTHYALHRGNLWVVPNLNFESIVKRSRGVHGDMNRKFSQVSVDDPDFDRVEKIKRIILEEEVAFVFNLHDGSGFYRPEHVDAKRNPGRWGQSIIIDQESIAAGRFGDLGALARSVADTVNADIGEGDQRIHVKNTRTREGDAEMEKTLTYFSINNGKPAVGIEASKTLPTHMRVLSHLRVLEAYLDRLGVVAERRIALAAASVKDAVDNNVSVSFYGNRLFLDMAQARRRLGYVPLKKDAGIEFIASSPLVAITGSAKGYRVSYGNRRVTTLHPQHFEYDSSIESVELVIDERRESVPFGSVVDVAGTFRVEPPDGYRVNVIGWRRSGVEDERGQLIRRGELAKRFSVDRGGRMFRVEVYRAGKFAGMLLVRFGERTASAVAPARGEVS